MSEPKQTDMIELMGLQKEEDPQAAREERVLIQQLAEEVSANYKKIDELHRKIAAIRGEPETLDLLDENTRNVCLLNSIVSILVSKEVFSQQELYMMQSIQTLNALQELQKQVDTWGKN